MLRRSLTKSGWQVNEAADGQQAYDCVTAEQPELILLDLMMPKMDGFQFIEKLRDNPDWQSIPIVVLTGKDLTAQDHQFLDRCQQLSKRIFKKGSFPMEELLEEIRGVVLAPARQG